MRFVSPFATSFCDIQYDLCEYRVSRGLFEKGNVMNAPSEGERGAHQKGRERKRKSIKGGQERETERRR